MTFERAVRTCPVRGAIYRDTNPRGKLYAKNHEVPLEVRVPIEDQRHDDWEEWDGEGCDNAVGGLTA